jgi:hypothetical protein
MSGQPVESERRGFFGISLGRWRFGVEFSRVHIHGLPYLDRWILHCGGTLRLHRFWRGDDARASHVHPWIWFVTFPFTSYVECVYSAGDPIELDVVAAWRPHLKIDHEHRVLGRFDGEDKPFWTLVVTGVPSQEWGFYTAENEFINWRDWL